MRRPYQIFGLLKGVARYLAIIYILAIPQRGFFAGAQPCAVLRGLNTRAERGK